MTTTGHPSTGNRQALTAVAAQFLINGMVYASIVPRLPDIRDRLAIDVAALGLILTIAAGGGLLGSALAGPAIERFGTRRSIVVSTAATLVILPLVGVSTDAVVLAAVLAGLAMLDVMMDIGMNIQGSRLSAERATPVMNRLHGLWSLGTVAGGLSAVWATAAEVPIWLHLLVVAAGLGLLAMVTVPHLLAADQPGDRSPAVTAGSGRGRGRRSRPASVAGHAMVLGLLGGAAVTMELTTSDWAAFRLADDLSVEPGRVGLAFVAFTSGMVTGRFAGDTIQALVGPRALVRSAAAVAAFGLAVATLVPGLGGIPPVPLAIGGFYVAALGVSVVFPQLYDAAAKAPGPPGRGLAALTAGTRVAGLASPVVVGLLADSSLSVGAAVASVTLPCCVVTFLVSPAVAERPSATSPVG